MNSPCTVDILDKRAASQVSSTYFWRESQEVSPEKSFVLSRMAKVTLLALSVTVSPITAIPDPWLLEQWQSEAVVTIHTTTNKMLISELGWSREQALETRLRFRTFEEDWGAPGMEAYDEL